MNKLLFLDIDGVLNYNGMVSSYGSFPLNVFDRKCVDRVKEILEATGAKLVVSSSWRLTEDLENIFKQVGLDVDFDVTPTFSEPGVTRGDEIAAYILEYKERSGCWPRYVILDDENDFYKNQQNHLIQTNWNEGLTDTLKEKCIEELGKVDWNVVNYLKGVIEKVDGEAEDFLFKKEILDIANKQNLTLEQFYDDFMEAQRLYCNCNWFEAEGGDGECSDVNGEKVAYSLDEMGEALGDCHLTCKTICKKYGFCAYINNIAVHAMHHFLSKYENRETGGESKGNLEDIK